jgi:hypothetical protein
LVILETGSWELFAGSWIVILLLSAFQVARITGVNHCSHSTHFPYLSNSKQDLNWEIWNRVLAKFLSGKNQMRAQNERE